MQAVSTKVVHLGDQLESVSLIWTTILWQKRVILLKENIWHFQVHQPRQRAFDALQMIQHFDEFLSDQPLNSMIFTDPDKVRVI